MRRTTRLGRLTNLLLVMALLFTQVPQMNVSTYAASESANPAYTADGTEQGFVSQDNGFIKYYVSKADGSFYILPSELPFNESKAASFGSFRLDSKEFIFGRSLATDASQGLLLPPFINELGTCQTSWIKDSFTVTQYLNIVQDEASANSYAVFIGYEVSSSTENPVALEARILLDTQFGASDNQPVITSPGTVFITNEMQVPGEITSYMMDELVSEDGFVTYGLLSDERLTQPTSLTFAHFANLAQTVFDYEPNGVMDFSSERNIYNHADSAVAYYFRELEVSRAAPVMVATLYGFKNLADVNDNSDEDDAAPLMAPFGVSEATYNITVEYYKNGAITNDYVSLLRGSFYDPEPPYELNEFSYFSNSESFSERQHVIVDLGYDPTEAITAANWYDINSKLTSYVYGYDVSKISFVGYPEGIIPEGINMHDTSGVPGMDVGSLTESLTAHVYMASTQTIRFAESSVTKYSNIKLFMGGLLATDVMSGLTTVGSEVYRQIQLGMTVADNPADPFSAYTYYVPVGGQIQVELHEDSTAPYLAVTMNKLSSGVADTVYLAKKPGVSMYPFIFTMPNEPIELDVQTSATDGPVYTYAVSSDPTSRTFAEVLPGYAAVSPQTFVLSNKGTGALNNLTATLSSEAYFDISTDLSRTSLPADAQTATVSVKPKNNLPPGVHNSNLLISADSLAEPYTIPLSFTVKALTYEATLTPAIHTFPMAVQGYTKTTEQTFELINTGTGTLTNLRTVFGSAYFAVSEPLSSTYLDPGNSASLKLRPVIGLPVGVYNDTITINGDNGFSVSADLKFTVDDGSNVTLKLSVTPETYTFTANVNYTAMTEQLFTVQNIGTAALSNIMASLPPNADFAISSALKPSYLDVGDTATVGVVPQRALPKGLYTTTLTIEAYGATSLQIPISFNVGAAPELSCEPQAGDFGSKVFSSTPPSAIQFTLTNPGTSSLTGVKASLESTGSSSFIISTALSSPTIAASNGTATISVQPRENLPIGKHSDKLVIVGNNGLSLSINLSFTVVDSKVDLWTKVAPSNESRPIKLFLNTKGEQNSDKWDNTSTEWRMDPGSKVQGEYRIYQADADFPPAYSLLGVSVTGNDASRSYPVNYTINNSIKYDGYARKYYRHVSFDFIMPYEKTYVNLLTSTDTSDMAYIVTSHGTDASGFRKIGGSFGATSDLEHGDVVNLNSAANLNWIIVFNTTATFFDPAKTEIHVVYRDHNNETEILKPQNDGTFLLRQIRWPGKVELIAKHSLWGRRDIKVTGVNSSDLQTTAFDNSLSGQSSVGNTLVSSYAGTSTYLTLKSLKPYQGFDIVSFTAGDGAGGVTDVAYEVDVLHTPSAYDGTYELRVRFFLGHQSEEGVTLNLTPKELYHPLTASLAFPDNGLRSSITKINISGERLKQINGEDKLNLCPDATYKQALQTSVYFGPSKVKTGAGNINIPATAINFTSSEHISFTIPNDVLSEIRTGKDNQDYYLHIGSQVLSVEVFDKPELRKEPYGVLGIARDSSNNHYIEIADNESDLATKIGKNTLELTLKGAFKYNATEGRYYVETESGAANVMLNGVVSYKTTLNNNMNVFAKDGTVTITGNNKGKNGSLSVPGLTFNDGAEFTVSLDKGVKYFNNYLEEPDKTNRNIELAWNSALNDIGSFTLEYGLGARVDSILLLNSVVVFGGKANIGILGTNIAGVEIDRLQYKMINNSLSFDGLKASGYISFPDLLKDKINFGANASADIDTFKGIYAFELGVDLQAIAFEGKLVLVKVGNALVPDALEIFARAEPGIPIIPPIPIGYIVGAGGGFSGLSSVLKNGTAGLKDLTLIVRGELQLMKIVSIEELRLELSMLRASLSGKAAIGYLGFKVPFGDFAASYGLSSYTERDFLGKNWNVFQVQTNASVSLYLVESFRVFEAGGSFSFTGKLYTDPGMSSYKLPSIAFSGLLYGKVQIPQFSVDAGPFHFDVGPFTLLERQFGVSNEKVWYVHNISLGPIDINITASYRWGANSPTISFAEGMIPGRSLVPEQEIYDENGKSIGRVQFMEGLRVLATGHAGEPVVTPASLSGGSSALRSLSLASNDPDVPKVEKVSGAAGDPVTTYKISIPEAYLQSAFIVVNAPKNSLKAYEANGLTEIALVYPREIHDGTPYTEDELSMPGINAIDFTPKDSSSSSIMVATGKSEWYISSTVPFSVAVMETDAPPTLKSVTYDEQTKTISWETANLGLSESYSAEIYATTDNMMLSEDYDMGYHLASVDANVKSTVLDETNFPSSMPTGDYFIRVDLHGSKPVVNKDPEMTMYASVTSAAYTSFTNTLTPSPVKDLTVENAGNGMFKATWTSVSDEVYYVLAPFDANGDPIYAGENSVVTYTVSPAERKGNKYEVLLSGLELGQEYKFQIVPYIQKTATVQVTETETQEIQAAPVYGEVTTSNPVTLATPTPPQLNLSYSRGQLVPATAETSINKLMIDGAFDLSVATDNAATVTVTLSTWEKAAVPGNDDVLKVQTIDPTVAGSGTYPINLGSAKTGYVEVIAVNPTTNDSNTYAFLVQIDDLKPTLFVVTNAEGKIVADNTGNIVITGSTEAGTTISVLADTLEQTTAKDDGSFAIPAKLSNLGTEQNFVNLVASRASGVSSSAMLEVVRLNDIIADISNLEISPSGEISLMKADTLPLLAKAYVGTTSYNLDGSAVIYEILSGSSVSIDSATGMLTALKEGTSTVRISLPATATRAAIYTEILTVHVEVDPSAPEPDPEPQPTSYRVLSVSAGTGGTVTPSGSENREVGASISVTATANSNYRFSGWTAAGITVANTASLEFIMPDNDVSLTANFTRIGGDYTPSGGGGGGSTSNQSTTSPTDSNPAVDPNPTDPVTPPVTTAPVDTEPETVEVFINDLEYNAILHEDGSIEIVLTEADILSYLSGVYAEQMQVRIPELEDITLSIPLPSLGDADLAIATDFGILSISNSVLQVLREKYGDTLVIVIRKGSFSLEILQNGVAVAHHDPEHPMLLSLPYAAQEGQRPEAVVAVSKEDDGRLRILPLGVFREGNLSMAISGTGTYNTLYNPKEFSDVQGHWAENSILFTTARELFVGVSENEFAPGTTMTRAMFATVLARLDGADITLYRSSPFVDVPTDAWFASSVAWANAAGIVSGVSENHFDPHAGITREQMAAMLSNYLFHKGIDPQNLNDSARENESAFNDTGKISAWAASAVMQMQKCGILSGKPGNIFDPQGSASRAEVAAVFSRVIEKLLENIAR